MAKSLTKTYCSRCKALIVPTKKSFDLLNEYGIKNDKYIIPTGIDLTGFSKENIREEEITRLRKLYFIGENDKVLLSIGRVAKEKSLDVIIRAFPEILKKTPGLKLVIVGDGPAQKDLISLSGELGVSEHVVFTGEVPWEKIASYYRLGDVFISASKSESQGLTYIEAMASGLPVVAVRDECIEGIIENKESGFVFDDADELPELISGILSDEDMSARVSQNALLAVQRFCRENYAKSVLKVYENVLKKRVEDV